MVEKGHQVTCYNRMGKHVSGSVYDLKYDEKWYRGIRLKKALTVNIRGLAAVSSAISATMCVAFGKYDVVHYHAEGSCVMMWIAKLLGKRCIVTIHGLDYQRAKWGKLARKIIYFLTKVNT